MLGVSFYVCNDTLQLNTLNSVFPPILFQKRMPVELSKWVCALFLLCFGPRSRLRCGIIWSNNSLNILIRFPCVCVCLCVCIWVQNSGCLSPLAQLEWGHTWVLCLYSAGTLPRLLMLELTPHWPSPQTEAWLSAEVGTVMTFSWRKLSCISDAVLCAYTSCIPVCILCILKTTQD